MREYQVVLLRLSGRAHEDEETLTDLLNERARSGWVDHSLHPLDSQKLLLVFTRQT